MQRTACASLFALLLAATAAAQEAVQIKIDKPQVGDRVKHSREEKSDTKITITVGGMDQKKDEAKTKTLVYVEEVLAVPEGADRATKLTRTYEKAQITSEGKSRKLDVEGKTVLIEKKGDKFDFTVEGKAVEGESLTMLQSEFNKEGKEEPRDLMLPKQPVKPGETWKIDAARLTKNLGDNFSVDKDKLEATGKLVKTYKKDGKQFGVIDLKVSAPITGLGEKSPVKVKDGSMVVTMAGDGCIDGTSAEGKSTMVMKFTVEGGVQGADLKVDATVTENRTSAPLPKK